MTTRTAQHDAVKAQLDAQTRAHLLAWCREYMRNPDDAFETMVEALETSEPADVEYYLDAGWPALADSLGLY